MDDPRQHVLMIHQFRSFANRKPGKKDLAERSSRHHEDTEFVMPTSFLKAFNKLLSFSPVPAESLVTSQS
jgi:hypothetical protein